MLSIAAITFALGASVGSVPAVAASTTPTLSPSTFTAGQSPETTVTYSLPSGSPAGTAWTGAGFQGFSIPINHDNLSPTNIRPSKSGSVVTCDFSSVGGPAVTFTSAGLAARVNTANDECYAYSFTDGLGKSWVYYEIEVAAGLGTSISSITISIPAGALTAPTSPGTYDYEAYSWDGGAYIDQTVTPVSVVAAASAGWTVVRQGLGLPATGNCADVADSPFAWGTGLSGGWTRAWQEWIGSGTGGWGCSRVLVNRGGHSWVIDNSA